MKINQGRIQHLDFEVMHDDYFIIYVFISVYAFSFIYGKCFIFYFGLAWPIENEVELVVISEIQFRRKFDIVFVEKGFCPVIVIFFDDLTQLQNKMYFHFHLRLDVFEGKKIT